MKIAVRLVIPCALMVALLSLVAGRWDVWAFWAWTAILWSTGSATYLALGRKSPELVQERMKPPSDRDRATRWLVALPLLAHLVIAGLDARFRCSPVPLLVQIVALVLFGAAFVLVGWALLSNPFASSAVRIQEERSQKVIDTGPYAIVRHPMYSAVVLVSLVSGPALGSWLAAVPLGLLVAVFARRTMFEDRMLFTELPGYAEYAKRVRWRIVPGVY